MEVAGYGLRVKMPDCHSEPSRMNDERLKYGCRSRVKGYEIRGAGYGLRVAR